jgi:hypothetical protein
MITHQRKPVVNDLLGAQRLARAGKALGGGLDVQGVEATKHSTERAHRCGVLGRKHSPGTGHEKGKRGVARG